MFYEVYKDEEALAERRKTPHFLNYWNLMQDFGGQSRAQRPTIQPIELGILRNLVTVTNQGEERCPGVNSSNLQH